MKSKIFKLIKYSVLSLVGFVTFVILIGVLFGKPVDEQIISEQESQDDSKEIVEKPEVANEIEEEVEVIIDEVIETSIVEVIEVEEVVAPIIEPPIVPVVENEEDIPVIDTGNKYYTSSHHTAKFYYPEDCSDWQNLSPKYLKSFNTLEDLLSSYNRELSPQCN